MKNKIGNASRLLTLKRSWELVALLLLVATVMGVVLRTPVKSFPEITSVNDPYDLHPERSISTNSNRVETGL